MTHLRAACLVAILATTCPAPASPADYKAEYDNKIKTAQDISAIGNDLAGDSVNLFTGAVSFAATDISVPSNGMTISLARNLELEQEHMLATVRGNVYDPEIYSTRTHRFGNWDLNVPRIVTVMTQTGGWIVDSATPTNRCSIVDQTGGSGSTVTGAPPAAATPRMAIDPGEYWHGYTLFAGGTQQSLLAAVLPNAERPSTGGPYHWTTTANWWLSCLPALAGPLLGTPGVAPPGQGFLAIAPDGTKYTFNWLSKHNVSAVSKKAELDPKGYGTHTISRVYRAEYEMLATRVEDRFGNWTTYSWSNDAYPKLLSISTGVRDAAAEQTITLGYDQATGFIASATVVDSGNVQRTWTYQYDSGYLYRVVAPDASFWEYGLANDVPEVAPYCGSAAYPETSLWYSECFGGGTTGSTLSRGYVIHPSGARVDFTFDNHFLFTSMMGAYPLGIASKTISGAGLTPATWTYDYFPTKDELRDQCFSPAGCPSWVMRDERGPDGSLTRRLFDLESMLLGTLQGSTVASAGGGSPAIATTPRWGTAPLIYPAAATNSAPVFYRETDIAYVPDAQATYQVRVGSNPLGAGGANANVVASERRAPAKTTTQYQQGVVFSSDVPTTCGPGGTTLCMDQFANPIRKVASSSGGAAGNYSKTETTSYQHDYAKWVIGLVGTTGCMNAADCNGAAGRIVSRTDYDPATLLPWKTFGFDQATPSATLTYNSNGSVATARDARNFTTTLGPLTNYSRGVPRSIAFPDGTSITAVIGNLGQVVSVDDQLQSRTCYGYDPMRRLSSITYTSETSARTCDTSAWNYTSSPFQSTTADEFGISGRHWKRAVTTGSGTTVTHYDAAWRPVLVVTEDLQSPGSRSFVVTRFDGEGRKVFVSYPVGSLSTTSDPIPGIRTYYDALGRVTRVQQDNAATPGASVLNTDTSYGAGFTTLVTNPRGYSTNTNYQVYDTPSTDLARVISLPEGASTEIVRQPSLGKPVYIQRSGFYLGGWLGQIRRYVYDANERLCQTINPEFGTTIVDYDAAGNVWWTAEGQGNSGTTASSCAADRAATQASAKSIRTVDAMNRVTYLATPNSDANIATTYEPDGLAKSLVALSAYSGAQVVTDYRYNRRRLLLFEDSSQPSWYLTTIGYGYDANGNPSSLTYPNMQQVTYAPDALGRPTQVGSYATGINYYPNGAIQGFTYGNGLVHTMTQSGRQLPAVSVDKKPDNSIFAISDTLTYDANGNVIGIADGTPGGITSRTMSYDGLDRLTSAVSPGQWGTAAYTYDPIDNLRSAEIGGAAARQYRYNYYINNVLANITTPSGATIFNFSYDARGNLFSKNNQVYDFDSGNRLTSVMGKENYRYDGLGRRVYAADSVAMLWQYSKDGRELWASDPRRGQNRANIYLGNTVLATRTVDWNTGVVNVRYLHTDALGSPVAETDASGAVVKRNSYEPYGAQYGAASIDGIGYTGHVMDRATGLTYMQQRYYDPQVGRFLSKDPAASEFNRYNYASNNPYRFFDPDGRQSSGLCAIGGCNAGSFGSDSITSIAPPSDGGGGSTQSMSAAELRRMFGKGTAGMGHHWVPFGSTSGVDLPDEARAVFGQSVSGERIPSAIHCTGHCDYNGAVRMELGSWAKQNRVELSKMTAAQARDFVAHIRGGTRIPTINGFVQKINRFTELSARFGSPSFVRALYFFGFVEAAQQTMSINSAPCTSSPTNACEQ